MKRKLALILALVMVLSLAACGKKNRYTSSDVAQIDGEQMDFSSYVTPVSTAAPTPTPSATPTATPVPTVIITSTPVPSTVILNNGYVTITKSPTGETVSEGGSASFLAYANNFTSIQWIIANPDSSIIYDASNAPNYIPGLQVSGQGASLLSLSNIPAELNGWKVQAIFSGLGGPAYTNVAYISVITTSTEEKDARSLAVRWSEQIAKDSRTYGFDGSDITSFSYFSYLADFEQTFTKGSWTVYAEFIAETQNPDNCYPLAATVYYGTDNVTSSYPLTSQTWSAFFDLLNQLT